MSLAFLMCSERSGSNFIAKLLNGHKNICGPSTKHIIKPLACNFFRYGDLNVKAHWNALLTDIDQLLAVEFSVWKKQFTLAELETLAPTGDLPSLVRNLFLSEAQEHGKQHVFIKENHIYEFLPFLLLHFPEAKVIYQVRDPRDMALSWKKHQEHYGGVVVAAKQWQIDQQFSLQNYYLLKAANKAHLVKYENLISNTTFEVKQMTDFLGLPYDEGIHDFYKDELTRKNAGMRQAWNNLSRGVLADNSGKYREGLSDMEIKIVEKICYTEMQYLGYTPEFDKTELDALTEVELETFNQQESTEKTYTQSAGVKAVAATLGNFYQHNQASISPDTSEQTAI
jgi:hypothetical protein